MSKSIVASKVMHKKKVSGYFFSKSPHGLTGEKKKGKQKKTKEVYPSYNNKNKCTIHSLTPAKKKKKKEKRKEKKKTTFFFILAKLHWQLTLFLKL